MKSFAILLLAGVNAYSTYIPSEDIYIQWKRGANRIYDADGDGVEDNEHKSYEELDRFRLPAVFNTSEEINNTQHGDLPGHISKEFDINNRHEPREPHRSTILNRCKYGVCKI